MSETCIWFVGDMLGSTDTFYKVLNVVRHWPSVSKNPDVVLLSGNMTGSEICVVGEDRRGPYAKFRDERCGFDTEENRDRWASIVEKTLGGYIVRESDLHSFSPNSLDSLRMRRLDHWLDIVETTKIS